MITPAFIEEYNRRIGNSVLALQKLLYGSIPDVVIQQGSAGPNELLNLLKDDIESEKTISYKDISLPLPSVEGHTGELVVVHLKPRDEKRMTIWVLRGRHHFYESGSSHEATFAMRVCARYGAKRFILLNAAGGLSPRFSTGDIMVLRDCNTDIPSPNIGMSGNQKFVNCANLFDLDWVRKGLSTPESGVYYAVQGPEYESPFKAQLLKSFGVDAAGMSTIPEIFALRYENKDIKIVALSLITNHHFGSSASTVSHDEVKQEAVKNDLKLSQAIQSLLLALY